MNILTDDIPGHWPGEARQLIADLRRAYRALDDQVNADAPVECDLEVINDAISAEARDMQLSPGQAKMWRLLRSSPPGRIFTKRALHLAIYDGREPESLEKLVDVHICKIRNKLIIHKSKFGISTVWGAGYRVDLAENVVLFDTIPERHNAPGEQRRLLERFKNGLPVTQPHLSLARRALGLSLSGMGSVLNVGSATLRAWLSGGVRMPPRKLRTVETMVRLKIAGLDESPLSFKHGSQERRISQAMIAADAEAGRGPRLAA